MLLLKSNNILRGGINVNLLHEDDTTLFVMKDKADLFQKNKIMFPVLSHA